MALDQFKPTLWSRRFIVNTDKALVFKNVVNTNYQGEIAYGNQLKINEIGDITVSDYVASTGLTWQDVDDAQKILTIDQKKSFSFAVDDVDAVQMNVSIMDGAMAKAAHSMADTIDQYIANLYSQAGVTNATNLGSAAAGLNLYSNDMPSLITYMHRYLDESNVPKQGRWVVVPPWMMQLLRYASIVQGTGFLNDPNGTALAGLGLPGMGFVWYESNNVVVDSTNSEYAIMFGSPDALTYAGQLEKIEAIRREDYFSDGMRGLFVYGAKAVRPDHLGCVYANMSGITS
jgi:hypothetical protein